LALDAMKISHRDVVGMLFVSEVFASLAIFMIYRKGARCACFLVHYRGFFLFMHCFLGSLDQSHLFFETFYP
jgi:hypothetical protein